MGHGYAEGLSEQVQEGAVSIDMAVRAHLQGNMFPPLSEEYVTPAIDAIDAANAGDWQDDIDLPNGETWSAQRLVAALRLEAFLIEEDEPYAGQDDDFDFELDDEDDEV